MQEIKESDWAKLINNAHKIRFIMNYNEIFNPILIMQIFVLINPLSSLPVLMAASKKKIDVKKVAITAAIIAFVIALSMVFIGPPLLKVFGISLDSFRVAGGVVLLMLGIQTVLSRANDGKEIRKVDALVSIIATPLLTGPATISFVTIKSQELGQTSLIFNLFLAFLLVGIVFFIFSLVIKKIDMKITSITSRVLGLFLTAVAIEMIMRGLTPFIANFSSSLP